MSKGQDKQGKQDHFYGFDSRGLEKAAEAAKYLDSSNNAKDAYELTKSKEKTKQLELEDSKKQREIQLVQIKEEERRKTVQYETEMGKRKAEYQVQLEAQRDQQKMQHKESMAEQARQRDEESVQKQEAMRRDTLQYEYQLKASLKQQTMEQEQAQREAEERRKQALHESMMKKTEKEKRETQRQNIMIAMNMASQQIYSAFQNPQNFVKMLYYGGSAYISYHALKLVMMGATATVMGRFGKPQLVRETSKIYTNNYLLIPFMQARKLYQMSLRRTSDQLFKGIMFDEQLETQLRGISHAILNRRQHYAPTKNMLFYGPPGTGKTLFAKKLAKESGLEYAVMVGSDIAPLGNKAVAELNGLFDWAEKQKKGIILFIDEADAFLRSRSSDVMSEQLRNTVNAFLYRTGTPSDRVIVVLATNNPEQLDAAVHDRIDEVVGFRRPSYDERFDILIHYLMMYSTEPETLTEKIKFIWKHPRSLVYNKKIVRRGDDFTKELVEEIAKQTEGFSGRELTKMVVAWHDAAFAQPDAVLTKELMQSMLDKFKLQHKLKDTWTEAEARIFGKIADMTTETTIKAGSKSNSDKSAEMLRTQEELMGEINKDRISISQMAEAVDTNGEAETPLKQAKKTADAMRKKK